MIGTIGTVPTVENAEKRIINMAQKYMDKTNQPDLAMNLDILLLKIYGSGSTYCRGLHTMIVQFVILL
jgi:hypothetical protein